MSLRIRENAINSPFPNEWPKSRPLPETSRKYNRPKRCTFFEFARPVARTTTLGKPLPIDGVSDLDRSLYSGTKPNNQERCEIWTMKSL